MVAPKIKLQDIQLEEEVGRGAFSSVHKAVRDGKTYIVKVLKRDSFSSQKTDSFRAFLKEGITLARLNHPGLSKIFEIGEWASQWYLVLEYIEGETLEKILSHHLPVESEILSWATTLAGALAEVHRFNLIHRDIKPQNILIDSSKNAKLIDFGFVTYVTKEQNSNESAGTLLYASPEQTGMLKRSVDSRSDLYSLGVVLYECATGQPPFISRNVSELIRKHATEVPIEPHLCNSKISPQFSRIILKLLSKDPDERYQSARGLLFDLDRLKNNEVGSVFELGVFDSYPKDYSNHSFVGRGHELHELSQAWKDIDKGVGELLILEGLSGSGKSRLLTQFIDTLDKNDGLILRGKCIEKNPVPFAPLREIIENYYRFNQDAGARGRVEQVLRKCSEGYAPALKHFTPALMSSLKEDSFSKNIQSHSEQYYSNAIADFFIRFLTTEKKALFCIDDIQWLDDASLQVLKRIGQTLDKSSILMVVSCRNDAEESRFLREFIFAMKVSKMTRLPMPSLQLEDVGTLIRNILGGNEIDSELITQVASSSKGNPFAVGEYLRSILDEGLLRFHWGKWIFDKTHFQKLGLPTSLLELLVNRLNNLSEKAREILTTAAAMKGKIHPRILAHIFALSNEKIESIFSEGLANGVLERRGSSEYSFVHDRIKDALISETSKNKLRSIHQDIGEALYKIGSNTEEDQYEIAYHFGRGTHNNPSRVYETNLNAGNLAFNNYANEPAYEFFKIAVEALSKLVGKTDSNLYRSISEVCFRLDQVEDGFAYAKLALKHAKESLQKSEIRISVATGYLSRLNVKNAREEILRGLSDLGKPFPKNVFIQLVSTCILWLRSELLPIFQLFLPKLTNNKKQFFETLAKIYEVGGLISIHEFDDLRTVQFTLRGLYSGRRLGPSPELSSVYSSVALMFSLMRTKKISRFYTRKSRVIADKIYDKKAIAESLLYEALCIDISCEKDEGIKLLRNALKNFGHWLDHNRYLDGCFALILTLRGFGLLEEVWYWMRQALARTEQAITPVGTGFLVYPAYRAATLAALGRTLEASESMEEAKALSEKLSDDRFSWAFYLIQRLIYCIELKESESEIEKVVHLWRKKVYINHRFAFHYARYFYLFHSYARLFECLRASSIALPNKLEKLLEAFSELGSSRNLENFRGHYLVIKAGILFLQNQMDKALDLVIKAERIAEKQNQPAVNIEAANLKSLILKKKEKELLAKESARLAANLAEKIGWLNRSHQIRAEFQIEEEVKDVIRSEKGVQSQDFSAIRLKRQIEALSQVSIASASVLEPKRLANIALDEVIKILAAERGFLFLVKPNSSEIEMIGGRDLQGNNLPTLTGYSSTVVRKVQLEKQSLVISATESGPISRTLSMVTHDLKSIIAVPIMLKEELKGVLYLDSSIAKGVFTQDDVEVLGAVANQIAVSFETSLVAQLEFERRHLKSAFQQYLSPEIVDELIKDPKKLTLVTEKKELTVLFSDIRNFTTISETLSSEQLSELMNEYFTCMTKFILESGGVLDKFIGDAIMAFWGAPLKVDNHAKSASQVALDMLNELPNLNKRLRDKGLPALKFGVGINTGIMSVGNMGSHQRFNYTVMGDAVNIGSRLQDLTKIYGAPIIIGQETKNKLDTKNLVVRELDKVKVPGKEVPVTIYELMSMDSEQMMAPFVSKFDEGLKAYQSQNWELARECFSACLQIRSEDGPSQLLLSRAKAFAKNPPNIGWNGVSIIMRK